MIANATTNQSRPLHLTKQQTHNNCVAVHRHHSRLQSHPPSSPALPRSEATPAMYKVITADFVKVCVTNSHSSAVAVEQKYAKSLLIDDLKGKLEITTGGCAGTMELDLYSGDTLIGRMTNGTLLGSYPIEDGMRVHVTDQFVQMAVSAADLPKFELSDQQYNTKRNTVRDFLRRNQLGKYNADEQAKMAERAAEEQAEQERLAALAVVGARCLVTAKGPRRVGTVRFCGEFEGKTGIFVGVEFDEPLGVNDGTVAGRRYFECRPKYGSMVPLAAVTVGDYPVEEFDLDEEI